MMIYNAELTGYREALERWAVDDATPEDMQIIQNYIDHFGGMLIPDDVLAVLRSHAEYSES